MRANSQLKYHAGKITSYLSQIIDDLAVNGNFLQHEAQLKRLGKSHYHYGAKREHFKVRMRTVLYVPLS